MSIHVRVIEAGGSVTVAPCRLSRIDPDGSITDDYGRTFAGAPTTGSDWGEGTAPCMVGTLIASAATVAYFNFE